MCPGDNAIFMCMTTGGALVWETGSLNRFYNGGNQPPTQLGIFQLKLLEFAFRGVTVEITSTASATNVQPADNGVTLVCRETTNSSRAQAVLNIAGRLHAMCYM